MITWKIKKLDCYNDYNNIQNVVYSIHWRVTKSIDNLSINRTDKTDIVINITDFIPFENLTEEVVLGWLFEQMGNNKQTIEEAITATLNESISPTKVSLNPPWE
jgi:hypothetical protein